MITFRSVVGSAVSFSAASTFEGHGRWTWLDCWTGQKGQLWMMPWYLYIWNPDWISEARKRQATLGTCNEKRDPMHSGAKRPEQQNVRSWADTEIFVSENKLLV